MRMALIGGRYVNPVQVMQVYEVGHCPPSVERPDDCQAVVELTGMSGLSGHMLFDGRPLAEVVSAINLALASQQMK